MVTELKKIYSWLKSSFKARRQKNKNGKDDVPDAGPVEQWRNPKLQLNDVDRPYVLAGSVNSRPGIHAHAGRSDGPDSSNGSVVF